MDYLDCGDLNITRWGWSCWDFFHHDHNAVSNLYYTELYYKQWLGHMHARGALAPSNFLFYLLQYRYIFINI